MCPLTEFEDGLNLLHEADEDAAAAAAAAVYYRLNVKH